MSGRHWDGRGLLGALDAAAAAFRTQVDEINALNVFPVPDGDTGSNMVATLQSAIDEARAVDDAAVSVGRVASAFSFGALMGARGNSGVILSQFFRGMAEAVDGQREIDGRVLAEALGRACDAAYAAVGRPVEGTILTVARDVARAAREAAAADGAVEAVLAAATEAAAESVERTPSLLPVLRQAGVVDAGGRGLEVLLRGTLAYARGEAVAAPAAGIRFPSFELPEEEGGFGYETVYVVQPRPNEHLSLASIRDRLEEIGESVVVAGDERAVKVHVHSERPDEVIAFGLSLGTLSHISLENLDSQTREVRYEAERSLRGGYAAPAAAVSGGYQPVEMPVHQPRAGTAIVAVAPGEGLARIFAGLGVNASVIGGQGANPSAGEIAEAIHATGCEAVIVLPNNPNVRLAARQAGELCPDVSVELVPTRNAAEGIAAALAFEPHAGLKPSAQRMLRAALSVQTMQVTQAVRDARVGRRPVHHGDYMVLGPDDRLLGADTDLTAAVRAALGRLRPGFELLTLYRGADVGADEADQLADALREELNGVEIEVVDGGQPHYSYLIAAE